MSKRFFGKLPARIIMIEAPKYAFPDSHKEALSRAGRKSEAEKPLSPLTVETENAPRRKVSTPRAS